ncbi:MAG: hypothetical protein IPP72_19285 [Chitinophagaceae bacterium]|nr:hypothetical protein [Chitinophagaceae bacterium]
MELDEMKILWGEMSAEMEKQKKLTGSLIIRMANDRYTNKLNSILIPELLGTLVCIAGLLFITIEFQQLNTWYLQACGIIAVVILVSLPFLSFKSIFKLRSVNILQNNYRQSLLEYAIGKKRFVQVQKLSFYLSAVLLLVLLPVMAQLISGKDMFAVNRLWLWYAIAFPFFYPFSQWVFRSYVKTVEEAENMLKEL